MSVNIECVTSTRSQLGEGAVWDVEDARLWWVDITGGLIHRFDPETGVDESFDFGEPVGCLARRRGSGLVVAAKSGFHVFDPDTGVHAFLSDPEARLPDNRFNDGATDMQGRFWAGTMKDGGDPERQGSFYRLDPDLSVTRWRGEIFTTNGLAFAPDGKAVYVADGKPAVRTSWAAD